MDENRFPKGTMNYMSVRCHEGKKLSRKDDLESIVYIIVIMCNGYLPWHTIGNPEIVNDLTQNIRLLDINEKKLAKF